MGGSTELKTLAFVQGKDKLPICQEFKVCQSNYNFKFKLYLSLLCVLCGIVLFQLREEDGWESQGLQAGPAVLISVVFGAGALLWCLVREVTHETLLITVWVNLQLTTRYASGYTTTVCIPWHELQDLIIIEVITGQKVLYLLSALVVEPGSGSSRHVLLFNHTRPRLHQLQAIYQQAQPLIDLTRLR